MGITSMGSGKAPSTSTSLDSSAMQTNFLAAAALDEMEVLGGLVGAVHIEGHVVDVVEIEHGYAVLLETLGRGIRARHRTVELELDRRQRVDEKVGGGAGADADDGAGLYVLQRRIRRGLFKCVL